MKRVKYKHLEDTLYKMELNSDDIVDKLGVIYNPASTDSLTLIPGIDEISDTNLMLKSLLAEKVKKITIDDIRLRSNLANNKTIRFTKKSFLYTTLGFTQSNSGPICDIENSFSYYQVHVKAINLITSQESIKSFKL